jgi:hypothetical protein
MSLMSDIQLSNLMFYRWSFASLKLIYCLIGIKLINVQGIRLNNYERVLTSPQSSTTAQI